MHILHPRSDPSAPCSTAQPLSTEPCVSVSLSLSISSSVSLSSSSTLVTLSLSLFLYLSLSLSVSLFLSPSLFSFQQWSCDNCSDNQTSTLCSPHPRQALGLSAVFLRGKAKHNLIAFQSARDGTSPNMSTSRIRKAGRLLLRRL